MLPCCYCTLSACLIILQLEITEISRCVCRFDLQTLNKGCHYCLFCTLCDKKKCHLLAVIKEITIWTLGGSGREKTTSLCVTQQETSSKGHRLLTACTLVCFNVKMCLCVTMILAPPEVVYNPCVGSQNRGSKLGVAVQTESLNLFKILTMFTKIQKNFKTIFEKWNIFTLNNWDFEKCFENVHYIVCMGEINAGNCRPFQHKPTNYIYLKCFKWQVCWSDLWAEW